MNIVIDHITFFFDEIMLSYSRHFAGRDVWQWLLFFFPFFIFGEIPRYVMPSIILLFTKLFGLNRNDMEQKAHFMSENPGVSVLLVGYNEEKVIEHSIRSLLQFNYPNMEIIVVDDGSTDSTYEKAKPFADQGLIQLYRNSAASGRAGRPIVSNMALQLSTKEFILSVDADTTFDRDTLLHMIGPFYDPAVGVVAGNLKVRNIHKSFWTTFQAMEYMQSITLWKSWLNLLGWNMQASGAFGAFRREVLESMGGWDPELSEDADVSLKAKKAGWKIAFACDAIAMTHVPDNLKALTKQRYRWDRGTLRTYFRKHIDLMNYRHFSLHNFFELLMEMFFTIIMTFVYMIWLVWIISYDPFLLFIIFPVAAIAYGFTSLITLSVGLLYSKRWYEEWPILFFTPIFAFYKQYMRVVRLYALTLEIFRINYEEPYLPASAWHNAPKW